ncbi:MAG: hypothetical protein V7636_212 [Actinomycetota bacterium]|jgi:hypothetical protein
MSGPRARWLILAAALAPLLLAGSAGAEQTGPSASATYSTGLGSVVGATRPAGSLHVGATVGQETDRTYLRFAATAPFTISITPDPNAGTSSPETAEVLACAVPNGFDPEATAPAEVDCAGAPTARFANGVLTVEVAEAGDVALVPTGTGTWHVGFAADAAKATFESPAPATTSTTSSFATDSDSGPTLTPPSGTAGVALPPITTPPPSAAGQAIADAAEAPVAPPVATVTTSSGDGFRYAAVFGLPLVLVVVVGLAGDALTRPVRLREDST